MPSEKPRLWHTPWAPLSGYLLKKPRLRNLWVSGVSAVRLAEEAVEFAAGRIEGVLLLFRAVVDQWAAVGMNRVAK